MGGEWGLVFPAAFKAVDACWKAGVVGSIPSRLRQILFETLIASFGLAG